MTAPSSVGVGWTHYALLVMFFVLLAVAVVSDVRERRVSNRVTGTLLLLGLLASVLRSGAMGGLSGAFLGAGTGLVIWLPMYAFRLMGAGDVKLFVAGAAWIGWQAALIAAFATGLLGGVLGLLWLWHLHGKNALLLALAHAVRAPKLLQLKPLDKRERVPYAIAIAGGLVCGWWWLEFPLLRG